MFHHRAVVSFGLLAVLAFVVQASPSALGHAFIASKTGNLKGKALNTQKFLFNTIAIACTSATVKGSIGESELDATFVKAKVAFGGCEASKTAVTIAETEYEFDAEGALVISSFVVTDALAGCSIKVLQEPVAQVEGLGESLLGERPGLTTVKYDNGSSKVEALSAIQGLSYRPSGGVCGSAKLGSNGQYEGKLGLELEGGTLEWGASPEPEGEAKGIRVEFTRNVATSQKVITWTFPVETRVKTLSIDSNGMPVRFTIVAGTDSCTEKVIAAAGTCSVTIKYTGPVAGLFSAELDMPYKIVSTGRNGLDTSILVRPA